MIAAEDAVAEVGRRLQSSSEPLLAFWIQVPESRDSYADDIRRLRGDLPIAPLVVRGEGFSNPNTVFFDLLDLLETERRAFDGLPIPLEGALALKCAVVLLGKGELCIQQTSTPVNLPAWFPVSAGARQNGRIEDITWTSEAPLTWPGLGIGLMCKSLVALQGALLMRLASVHQANPRTTNALLNYLRPPGMSGPGFEEILTKASEEHRGITNPTAYRPRLSRKASGQSSLISKLWALSVDLNPGEILRRAGALADALGLKAETLNSWHESMASVLTRTHQREQESDMRLRFARNVIVTVGATCQLITTSHHADEYGPYPIPLMRSISYDLRCSLADGERLLLGAGSFDSHS